MSLSDNEAIQLIVSRLDSELAAWPWVSPITVGAQQKQQPTQQGVPSKPAVYVEKLFDRLHGSPEVKYLPNANPAKRNEVETQVYLTTYQVSATITQNPNNILLPTASDLVDVARMILQRRSTIREFTAAGLNLLRVTDIRNSYFTNERDRQEAMPSFDLVFSFVRSTPPAVVDQLERVQAIIVQV